MTPRRKRHPMDIRPNRSRHVPETTVRAIADELGLNPAWLLEPGVRGAWSESLARKLATAGHPEWAHAVESGRGLEHVPADVRWASVA